MGVWMDWGPIVDGAAKGQLQGISVGYFAEKVAWAMGCKGQAYVATPYSRESVDGSGLWSFEASLRCARLAALELDALRVAGMSGVSPIVMAHAMVEFTGQRQSIGHGGSVGFVPRIDPLDDKMWMRWCHPIVAASACVVVPDLPGWDRSAGIKAEVRAAIEAGKPVFLYAAPDRGGV